MPSFNNKYLPIITARGGSKGLKNKNILDLSGKPLIAYTIESFLKSNIGGDCYVTTDNLDIANISKKYGAKIVDRPDEISQDFSSSAEAVIHLINDLKNKNIFNYTHFILLQPTSPLRTAHDINRAVEMYEKNNSGSVVSMTEPHTHPYKHFILQDDWLVKPLFGDEFLAAPRQILPKILSQNGAIYVVEIETFLKNQLFCQPPVIPYIMPPESSVDIDTEIDLKMAEFILNSKLGAS